MRRCSQKSPNPPLRMARRTVSTYSAPFRLQGISGWLSRSGKGYATEAAHSGTSPRRTKGSAEPRRSRRSWPFTRKGTPHPSTWKGGAALKPPPSQFLEGILRDGGGETPVLSGQALRKNTSNGVPAVLRDKERAARLCSRAAPNPTMKRGGRHQLVPAPPHSGGCRQGTYEVFNCRKRATQS